ncbi:MAG: XdhC family protein [Tissierellia bacterium]|nr:XdhC family protein [Tissierellia bacterium]
MKELLKYGIEFYEKNIPFVLVLILEKHGSAPRGAGAGMLVPKEGSPVGTIGGGAIEFESIQRAKKVLENRQGEEYIYRLTNHQAENIGMICGGENRVGFFRFGPEEKNQWLKLSTSEDGKYLLSLNDYSKVDIIVDPKYMKREWKTNSIINISGIPYFYSNLHLQPRVFIFGGGHVSRALSKILHFLNFDIHVIEDREEFLDQESFPIGTSLYLENFGNPKNVNIKKEDYVCVMTRGHKSDTEILLKLLKNPPTYVGVIGSRKKVLEMKRSLEAGGISREVIDSLYSPIGLDIGAETPEEIGISIAAEMIQVFRKVKKG